MVFGFGKKKSLESSTSPTRQEKEILLHDIPSFLKELESPRLHKIIQEAKRIKSEIDLNRKNINAAVLEFEADDLKLGDVDKNLKIVVKRGKDAVVSTVKKEISSKLSNLENYDNVLTFNIEISQILKRIGDILGLHTRVMHVFARKYAEKLKEEISRLAQNRNSLQNLINEQENFRMDHENILESMKKIDLLKLENTQKDKRLAEIVNEIDKTKKNIAALDRDMIELKSKQEYQEFLQIKKKIDLLSGERKDIKDKIDSQFLKISRPLSKYTYISSFEKPMKKMMEELLADPYQVISVQNKSAIIDILEATTKSVLAGNISVKDSDKSIQQIEETITRLDEFLMLKETYANKLSYLESSLRIFDARLLESKERDLQKTKSNLSDLESSAKKIESEIEENVAQISNVKSELETSLSHLAHTKMTIKS
jgi:hypothetical protein